MHQVHELDEENEHPENMKSKRQNYIAAHGIAMWEEIETER